MPPSVVTQSIAQSILGVVHDPHAAQYTILIGIFWKKFSPFLKNNDKSAIYACVPYTKLRQASENPYRADCVSADRLRPKSISLFGSSLSLATKIPIGFVYLEVSVSTAQYLKSAAKVVQPTSFMDYHIYLETLYQTAKTKAEKYSYQRFAEDLGFGSSTLMHQIIQGYRPLTLKTATKIADALALADVEREYFLKLVTYQTAKKTDEKDQAFQRLCELITRVLPKTLDQDLMEYFSRWYHPVIREMVAMPHFQGDPQWIAKTICPPIKPHEARESLELLVRIGYVEYHAKTDRYTQSAKHVSSGEQVMDVGLVQYHQHMIDLARESLMRFGGEQRNISAVTVACDPQSISRFKALIGAFQTQLLREAEQHPGNEVMQVNIQLFPVTKGES